MPSEAVVVSASSEWTPACQVQQRFMQHSGHDLRFLVALNQDVEIVVRPHRDKDNARVLHVS
jgi:hypothetical protein